jgi:uncharacterized membrane protein YedE/YeeE
LIFGVGFALGGLCPGTSCVAAVTGRLDGVALVLGMWSGVLATGLLFPLLAKFYDSTPRGSLTLPQLTGLPYGVVVLAIVLVALAGFRGAQWLESRPRTQAASRSTPNDVREPRRALEGVGR